MPTGWAETLAKAHHDASELGVIACWHFFEEDFVSEFAARNIRDLRGGIASCLTAGSAAVVTS